MQRRAPAAPTQAGWLPRAVEVVPMMLMVAVSAACSVDDGSTETREPSAVPNEPDAGVGDFFATVRVASAPSVVIPSDGDLWPSCWSDDDHVYAAWGDGNGFEGLPERVDIGVGRITGSPREGAMTGTNLALADAVGQIWSGARYNRKPTGMVCLDGDLYLAVQDLALDFDDAPAATIARSRDKGRTWQWDRSAPMFRDHALTTLFFLDFGKDGERAIDEYVYAYALDGNWRRSYAGRVADPTRLSLARVPRDALQDASKWQWFAGPDEIGEPLWTGDPAERQPVLEDARRIYRQTTPDFGAYVSDLSMLSQGSVVYDAPLDRYIYTSWTEYTFEFYEAPAPWGPFRHFLTKDFGGYPWSSDRAGGYATTIPSKFIADDGRSMYVQANTFISGASHYGFALRELVVTPRRPTPATNVPGEPIPTRTEDGAVAIARHFRGERAALIGDGAETEAENSYSGELKAVDYWGYTWPQPYHVNWVRYTSGGDQAGCNDFEMLTLEVRRDGIWQPVDAAPSYQPHGAAQRRATFAFPTMDVNGVRILGKPSGSRGCTSIAELSVRYEAQKEAEGAR